MSLRRIFEMLDYQQLLKYIHENVKYILKYTCDDHLHAAVSAVFSEDEKSLFLSPLMNIIFTEHQQMVVLNIPNPTR